MFKRLREEWIYWRYRNITRRWQLLRPRLMRLRRRPAVSVGSARARGTAMYSTTRPGNARGLVFAAVAAAILTVVNTLIGTYFWLDLALFAGMAYAYTQYAGI